MKLLSELCLYIVVLNSLFFSNFTVISACSSLSTSFRKPMSGSRIDDRCDALFFFAILRSCGIRVIIRTSIILVCL